LYGNFLSTDGKAVDYEGIKLSPIFRDYVDLASHLITADITTLTADELKSFVINIYNALVVHGTVVLGGFDASVAGSIGKFFTSCSYVIGGLRYSLDELEHGILRNNAIHPSSGLRYFSDSDPRRSLALPLDPRIHFALVCGAKSCPPIRVFSASNIDEGLNAATKSFLNDISIHESTNVITMSKILFWYSKDFGETDEAKLKWVSSYLVEEGRGRLLALLSKGARGDTNLDGYTLEYSEYNWSVNSK